MTESSTPGTSQPNPNYEDDVEGDDDYFIPYGKRQEWSDVEPIEPLAQTPLPHQVLVIDYSPKFLECFNYFRAVMARGEKSVRALQLTTDAIQLNAANYTVWQYRRDILQALGVPHLISKDGLGPEFLAEFEFSLESINQNEKNYQVWHHRKILTQWAGGYSDESDRIELSCPEARHLLLSQELDLTARLLRKDAKNYHAWQHRQWTLNAFNSIDGEMDFVDKLLVEDVRNNSAWNQRYFVVTRMGDCSPDLVLREVFATWAYILRAPANESPWSYLEGIYRLNPDVSLANCVEILPLCEGLLKETINNPSPPLLGVLLSVYEQKIDALELSPDLIRERVTAICDLLENVDKVRAAYWSYRRVRIQSKFGEAGELKESSS